jgi:tetratricopeptide (TPR) repeat protein
VLGNLFHTKAEASIDEGNLNAAVIWAQQGCEIGRKVQDTALISANQTACARAWLYRGNFCEAVDAAREAKRLISSNYQHYTTLLLAVIELKSLHLSQARELFIEAFAQASALLVAYAHHYAAYDTQALALYGQFLCDESDWSEVSRLHYKEARALNSDPGVVNRVQHLWRFLGMQETFF